MVDDIKRILRDRGIEEEKVSVSAIFSRGSVSVALHIAQKDEFSEIRKRVEDYVVVSRCDKKAYETSLFRGTCQHSSSRSDVSGQKANLDITDVVHHRGGGREAMWTHT